eukprot:IDg18066t1
MAAPSELATAPAPSLAMRPSPTSIPVLAALSSLRSSLDATALGRDLQTVPTTLSRSAKLSRGIQQGAILHAHLHQLRSDASQLFQEARHTLCKARAASRLALQAQPTVERHLATACLQRASELLRTDEARAKRAGTSARKLALRVCTSATTATQAAEAALTLRDAFRKTRITLHHACEKTHAARAQSWHAHTALLQSLSEYGRLHSDARGAARSAERRAGAAGFLSFVHVADRLLGASCGVQVLSPLSGYLKDVQDDADTKRDAEAALMDAKKRRRTLSRNALNEMDECSRVIASHERDIADAEKREADMQETAASLRLMAAAAVRVELFWPALADALAECGALALAVVDVVEQVAPAKQRLAGTGEGDGCV